MLYVRFPLSLRNVEDLLHERGVDVSYESVRYWWHRFGSQFASQIKKRRAGVIHSSNWKWHLDEVFVKINGERHYLWRASVRLVCLYILYILTNLRLTYDNWYQDNYYFLISAFYIEFLSCVRNAGRTDAKI